MTKSQNENYLFEIKWSPIIKTWGFTGLPNVLLYNLEELDISTPELSTLCILLSHKWDERHPFPGVETIAKLVRRDMRTVRRHLSSLQGKGIMTRSFRPNNTTEYDFSPLIERLEVLTKNVRPGQKRHHSSVNSVTEDRSILPSKEDTGKQYSTNNLQARSAAQPIQSAQLALVDEVIAYWNEKTELRINNHLTANRKAASKLLSLYGADGVKQLINGSAEALNDRYAPTIGDLCQLNDKVNQLIAWGRKRNNSGTEII